MAQQEEGGFLISSPCSQQALYQGMGDVGEQAEHRDKKAYA